MKYETGNLLMYTVHLLIVFILRGVHVGCCALLQRMLCRALAMHIFTVFGCCVYIYTLLTVLHAVSYCMSCVQCPMYHSIIDCCGWFEGEAAEVRCGAHSQISLRRTARCVVVCIAVVFVL